MKRAIGYIFFAIMLIVTWGIRLGLPKTYCLGLSSYQILSAYKWTFCYVTVSGISIRNDDKSLRLAIEQGWRAKNGWPILCGK